MCEQHALDYAVKDSVDSGTCFNLELRPLKSLLVILRAKTPIFWNLYMIAFIKIQTSSSNSNGKWLIQNTKRKWEYLVIISYYGMNGIILNTFFVLIANMGMRKKKFQQEYMNTSYKYSKWRLYIRCTCEICHPLRCHNIKDYKYYCWNCIKQIHSCL